MEEDCCPLCEEPVTAEQARDPRAQCIGGLGENRIAHRECLLRDVMGGIGHVLDHGYWCGLMHDTDGGRTPRQSALEVDEWVSKHGVRAP